MVFALWELVAICLLSVSSELERVISLGQSNLLFSPNKIILLGLNSALDGGWASA